MNKRSLIKTVKSLVLNVGIASGMTVATILYFFIVIIKGSGFVLLFLDIVLTIFDWLCVYWDWDCFKTLTKDNI
jgi:hypothetical protein